LGGIFYLLALNFIPGLHDQIKDIAPLQGAGPAILAVAVATTFISPGFRIFPFLNGGIPLWILTIVFALVDYAFISNQGAGVLVAHFAGALSGTFYVTGSKQEVTGIMDAPSS
jgi:hypothetical protein